MLDTNVVVSAVLFPQSQPRLVVDNVIRQEALLISSATQSELDDVLLRNRFDRHLQRERRREFLNLVVQEAELVEISQSITACRDPKDNKFLELAVSGQATHIISGDSDLLTLHPFRGIPILTPRTFLLEGRV